MPRPLRLVIEAVIPFERTDQIAQAHLLPSRNEFAQRLGDRRLPGPLAADLQGAVEQIRVDRHVGCRA
jgi:hypothetical protein